MQQTSAPSTHLAQLTVFVRCTLEWCPPSACSSCTASASAHAYACEVQMQSFTHSELYNAHFYVVCAPLFVWSSNVSTIRASSALRCEQNRCGNARVAPLASFRDRLCQRLAGTLVEDAVSVILLHLYAAPASWHPAPRAQFIRMTRGERS